MGEERTRERERIRGEDEKRELQIDWTRKEILQSRNNQNTKCTKQRKNIKRSKGKRSSNI